jgi:hypothetical protein
VPGHGRAAARPQVGIAYVADKTSEENRAACIGLLIAIAALGIVAAPIGAALPYTLAFLTSNVLNAFTVRRRTTPRQRQRTSLGARAAPHARSPP